jgi:hypothetical protein
VVSRVRPSGKIRNPVEFSATWGDWDSFRQVETSENGIKEAAVGKLAPKQTVEPGKKLNHLLTVDGYHPSERQQLRGKKFRKNV